MLKLLLDKMSQEPLKVLCLGAHCDDIEIGCGGTILTLIERMAGDVEFYWMVFSSTQERKMEAHRCAKSFLQKVSKKTIIVAKIPED